MASIIGEMELKRVSWTYKETIDLLEYCRAKEVGKILSQKRCNKKLVYQEMFNQMVRLGYDKTMEQVIIKFKNLHQKYRKGLPSNPSMQMNKKRFELWTLMHEIFKHGPIGRCTKAEKEKESPAAPAPIDVKKERNSIEDLNELRKDPLTCEPLDQGIEIPEPKSLKEHVEQSTLRLKKEVDLQEYGNLKYFSKPPTKADRSTANYLRCVRYLVEKFKAAQEELQNKFYIQQLKLQQQQQDWEEKILDEEREFFVKILKQSEAEARKKSSSTEIKEEEEDDEDELML